LSRIKLVVSVNFTIFALNSTLLRYIPQINKKEVSFSPLVPNTNASCLLSDETSPYRPCSAL